MPPVVPRKRLRETSPSRDETEKSRKPSGSAKQASKAEPTRRKATLYDDLDATTSGQNSSLLHNLDEDDDSSSLTSLSDLEPSATEFEDVPLPNRQKAEESGEDDEDIEFEDVAAPETPATDAPVTSGDLELTLNRDTRVSLTNQYGDKKGPSKRGRQVRNAAHSLHVLFLLWHNAVRNSWICDMEVQAILISHLPPRLWEEVERWTRSSGLEKHPSPEPPTTKPKTRSRGRHKGSTKGKSKAAEEDKSRDWGSTAGRLENGVPDMSHGDPLFRLMQSLSSWWRQRFKVTAPGLRKWGYMPLERLDRLTKAHRKLEHDPDLFGERFASLDEFRRCARSCRGSRDVGAQLFTALLRGLGMEARMVANLQTLGFGWNRLEEADAETEKDYDKTLAKPEAAIPSKTEEKTSPVTKRQKTSKHSSSPVSNRKAKESDPILVDDSEDLDLEYKDTDDESVVELAVIPRRAPKAVKKFDSDLEYPHYWTEVLSPVTNQYLPVDPIVKNVIATNRELVESLEPRGAKADKARQVMAYVIGYSQDGTAKDVTVRYLKRQVFPGRTKGARMPPEKIAIYNRHGKVKRHAHFDWFKAAMSGYRRGHRKAPITEIDELEDSTDLQPRQPEKKEVKEGEETLQYYKQSKEFVLQRHLKREEALKADAKPVKLFKNKVKGGKIEEEDVYLRADVLNVKSAETWHKQGRAPLAGEQPLKRVPYRAATLNRRRELMEAEAATGEKVLQGLFSYDQTDWIIPPPIENGVIPKNDYGNIDLFAEHMCPEGAIHLPYRGAVKVCKKLQIDFAEAVVGFEFGHRMAVPVIQGVVIAEENQALVMEELEKFEAERARKEDEKRKKTALGKWRKFLMGLRVVERIRQDYGEVNENVSIFGPSKRGLPGTSAPKPHEDEETAGGFLPDGYEEEDGDEEAPAHQTSGFFATAADEEGGAEDDGLVVEHNLDDEQPSSAVEADTSKVSKKSAKAKRPRKAAKRAATMKKKTTRRGRRKLSEIEDSDEDEQESWEGDSADDE